MNAVELLNIIRSGETSKVQFKQVMDDDKFAAEMIAMSNSKGGIILVGVEDKTGAITGLSFEQLQSYNNRLATIANDKVKPQIFIETEVVAVDVAHEEKRVLIVTVLEGTNKPYKDNNGTIWVKQGADKRKLIDNNEQLRLFQQSGRIYVDEMIVPNTSAKEVNTFEVRRYISAIQPDAKEDLVIDERLLTNLNVLKNGCLTLGGSLFFSYNPQKQRPAFCIKAVSFFGNSIGGSSYRNSWDIEGTIPEMYRQAMTFFTSNLYSLQNGQDFNSVGILEISKTALEELLQNAIVHRDYSKNAPIRIMIFDNRVEIISPGALPNTLTVENIKLGNAVVRNNLIVSYCSKLMKYRGFGSGITRALELQPDIELVNDVEGEQFIVRIPRPEK
jgi:predicted HTH transcriptional regulator